MPFPHTVSELWAIYICSIVFCFVTATLLPPVYSTDKDQSHLIIGESIPKN